MAVLWSTHGEISHVGHPKLFNSVKTRKLISDSVQPDPCVTRCKLLDTLDQADEAYHNEELRLLLQKEE